VAAAKPGLTGSFNSRGGGGTNEAESQPAAINKAASMAAIAAAPAAIPRTGQRRVVVVFKDVVLWLFRRDRWDSARGPPLI
jgi:hypothetical protein